MLVYKVFVVFIKFVTCRYVWVLEGDTGKVLQDWPVKLSNEVQAAPLVIKLVPGEGKPLDIVSMDSHL